jgi:fluoride ion exporter CrcB/FEX
MAVNILGAAIAGFVVFSSASVTQVVFALPHTGGSHLVYSVRSVPLRPLYGSLTMTRWSPYLLTGFCGGFTTFSSAIAIPALDWHHGHRARGVILMGLTPVVCVAGFWIGELMSKIFF